MAEPFAAAVLDSLPGAMVATDLEGRVTAWNRAAEEMFGWTATEAIGVRPPHVPLEAWDERLRWMGRAATGESIEVTTTRRHRDGRTIDVTLQMGALRNDAGELIGHVSLCRDATLRLQLERHEAELRLVQRLSSLAQRLLQDLDLGRVLNLVVEVAVDLLALDSGVISLEQRPGEFARVANVNIPPDLANHEILPGEGLHGQVIATGEPLILTDYATWEAGVGPFRDRGFHASVAVPMRRDGRVIGCLSVHTFDPERRFDAEEADVLTLLADYAVVAISNASAYRLVSSERERFLALVESMPDGLAVVEGGRVTAWNAAAARLTGRPASGVIGNPPPIDLDAASGGVEIEDDEGRVSWLETVRSPLPDVDGQVYVLRDMTEQRDLERAKDLFFATTSHELKTPLTVVKGLAATLHRHWDRMSEANRIEALETIERRAESLGGLIERILVGSRVQAGAFHATATPVDIRHVIDDIARAFGAASRPLHEVSAVLPAHLPLVAGDRQALDTILGHLVENAIKYSPSGGAVVVSARLDEDGSDGFVHVEVSDEGVGIDGDIEPLLAPFVQGDGRTTRRFGGVGLGLYIVGQLVRAQQGTLRADRRVTGGSRFTFTVPVWR